MDLPADPVTELSELTPVRRRTIHTPDPGGTRATSLVHRASALLAGLLFGLLIARPRRRPEPPAEERPAEAEGWEGIAKGPAPGAEEEPEELPIEFDLPHSDKDEPGEEGSS
jgi:hypothetical protein